MSQNPPFVLLPSSSLIFPFFINPYNPRTKISAARHVNIHHDQSRRLPTSRIIHRSGPLISPDSALARLSPFLFEFSRLLAVVPAVLGIIWCLWNMIYLPPSRKPPERIDFFVAALWTLLTGYQALSLTTGLLTRWSLYYPPLSTLIRLFALQAICWPATHITLKVLDVDQRPVGVWAVVGTTTCVSRSVQIWVTSNLWWEDLRSGAGGDEIRDGRGRASGSHLGGLVDSSDPSQSHSHPPHSHTSHSQTPSPLIAASASSSSTYSHSKKSHHKPGYWKRWRGGNWGGRRWDWKEVGVKCVLPAGVCYFVMAWAGEIRRELMESYKC